MHTRLLGASGIEVSEIALGSWLTFAGGVGREQARACTRAALDCGITLLDTANSYGFGAAEEAWGEILADYPRESYLLATKVFMPMGENHVGGLSAGEIGSQIDSSLRRLRTDYVDLYQCHRFDPDTAIEETVEALADVVRAGKARAIGFSEWLPEQIRAGIQAAGAVPFSSSQVQYNMLWRSRETEVFPLCEAHAISQLLWSPLAQGVLSGKYLLRAAPRADTRAGGTMAGPLRDEFGYLQDRVLERVQRLRPIADEAGLTMSQLALAWVLRRTEVASAIIGASRPDQVRENARASGVKLSDDVLTAIDVALGDAPVTEYRLVYRQRRGVRHRRFGAEPLEAGS